MTDPLNDALREATLAVLLGSTEVPTSVSDYNGNFVTGMTTIPSAFAARMQARSNKGDFDELIDQAVAKLTADNLVGLLGEALVKQILAGLESTTPTSGLDREPVPGWLQVNARKIAVEAATAALVADEGLLETLRQRIGMEVDRNRVGISVQLSDPEAAS